MAVTRAKLAGGSIHEDLRQIVIELERVKALNRHLQRINAKMQRSIDRYAGWARARQATRKRRWLAKQLKPKPGRIMYRGEWVSVRWYNRHIKAPQKKARAAVRRPPTLTVIRRSQP